MKHIKDKDKKVANVPEANSSVVINIYFFITLSMGYNSDSDNNNSDTTMWLFVVIIVHSEIYCIQFHLSMD